MFMHAHIKHTLLIVVTLLMTSCAGADIAQQLEAVLGVTEGETASSCVEITITTAGIFTPTTTTTTIKRVELPSTFDVSTMTPETLDRVNDNVCN